MTLVIAHRGFCAISPENTLASIKHAVDLGCDGVEFDVRSTKDHKLILFHDKTLSRMTGKRKKVSNTSFNEFLPILIQGDKVPLLDEVLEYLSTTNLKIIIPEIKVEGYESEILALLEKYSLSGRTIVSSNYASVLRKFRSLNPDLRLAYVMDNRPDKMRTWRSLNKELGLFSVHHFHNRPLFNERFIKRIKNSGLKVMPWFLIDIEQEDRIHKLISFGVDGIITNKPDRLISLLQAKHS